MARTTGDRLGPFELVWSVTSDAVVVTLREQSGGGHQWLLFGMAIHAAGHCLRGACVLMLMAGGAHLGDGHFARCMRRGDVAMTLAARNWPGLSWLVYSVAT
jgi:hypothetical protein